MICSMFPSSCVSFTRTGRTTTSARLDLHVVPSSATSTKEASAPLRSTDVHLGGTSNWNPSAASTYVDVFDASASTKDVSHAFFAASEARGSGRSNDGAISRTFRRRLSTVVAHWRAAWTRMSSHQLWIVGTLPCPWG